MAEQDSFIDEVTDEVRRDRLFGLFKRYGWIAILAILAIVGGAAWNELRSARVQAAAEARGDAVLAALDEGTPEARAAAIGAAAEGQSGDLAALLAMLAAGQASPDQGLASAQERLEALAGAGDLDPIYRDLAVLKSVALAGSDMAPDARVEALEPLTLPGAPYRVLALELVAYAEVDRGDPEAAIDILRDLTEDAETPSGLRQRASQMIVALGGSLETSDS